MVKSYLPVDIETTSLDFNRGEIIGIGYGEIYNTEGRSIPPLPASCHNGRFEYKYLKKAKVPFNWEFDTLLAASILIDRPESLDLYSVAQHYLGMEPWKDETDKLFEKKNWYTLFKKDPKLQEAMRKRNLFDLLATKQLTEILQKRLEKEGMLEFFSKYLMPAAKMLAEVEYNGMRIDVNATQVKLNETIEKINFLKGQLDVWAQIEINWNSPIQLKKFLSLKGYDLWIYDFKKKEMVQSTGVDSLERFLPNKNIELLLDYKEALKLKGFLEGWLEEQYEGKLFPSYNLANTRTGRLSCTGPNLQQVPRDKSIRSLFIPNEGKVFVIADYAQIEPRVAAHYSNDETLLDVFTKGLDFYGSIACNVLGITDCTPNEVKQKYPEQRKIAKEIGLSILYGIGAHKLSTLLQKKAGINIDANKTKKIIDQYFESYPGLLEFREFVKHRVFQQHILYNHYGRQFKIDPEKVFSTGVNTIIQSTASDACLFSQLTIDNELKMLNIKAPLVAIIHDEVIRECSPEDAPRVGEIMEKVMCNQGFNCPLKLEWVIGKSWGDKT